jgi:tetratricopeptide (TPR) repeat protein
VGLAGVVTVALAVVLIAAIYRSYGPHRVTVRAPGRRRQLTSASAPAVSVPIQSDGLDAYRWSLTVREQALGRDHPDVATACHILGAMYMERGRLDEAEPLLERALAIRSRSFGPTHSEVASTIDDLASLYRAQGRGPEAEGLISGLVSEPQDALAAPQVASIAVPVSSVASNGRGAHEAVNERVGINAVPDEAARTASDPDLPALHTVADPASAGSDPPELARVLGELAGLRDVEAPPATIRELYGRALAMMEARGATDRPELRTALRELGRLYYRQSAYAEAEPLLERALTLTERALGANAPEVAEIREDLAWLRFSRQSLH